MNVMTHFGKIMCVRMARSFGRIAGRRHSSTKSEMREFYSGKNIFITGSTGFLGKVLLEKILASIPDIGNVYVLIRGKKSLSFYDRFQQLRNEHIFTKYERVDPKNLSKMVGIEGHFGDHGLEISEKDRNTLTDQVNVVFHFASTIRLDNRLDIPLKSVFIGTKSMLSLAEDMRQLSSFVHVSTAYCNSNQHVIEEKVYDMTTDGDSVLSLYENNTNEDVDKMIREKHFIYPMNSYYFSKGLTEQYIKKCYSHLPVTIARPSVVTASLFEPALGYSDKPSALGLTLIYQGLGLCRYIPFNEKAVIDVIPVDITINALLIIAREVGLQTVPVTNVYNVTSASHWHFTYKQLAECKVKALMRSPPVTALRPFSHRTSEVSHFKSKVIDYFSEMLFAIVTDTVAAIRGRNSGVVKLTRFIQLIRSEQAIVFLNSWILPRKNLDEAVARLSKTDRELFPAIPIVKDNADYFYHYWMSLRELVMGEKPDNIGEARRRQKRLILQFVALPFFTATTCAITVGLYYL